jgi:hypothetical protein
LTDINSGFGGPWKAKLEGVLFLGIHNCKKLVFDGLTAASIEPNRDAMANLSQTRPNILPQILLSGCFLKGRIEAQNIDKTQALGALPAYAALPK